jgi:Flp pilus assembly pilin Flp
LLFRGKGALGAPLSPIQSVRRQGDDYQPVVHQLPGPLQQASFRAGLVEKLIPKFKSDHDRQFYREFVESYRTVARDILRKAWFDDKGQDIVEYAVMLAVILVLVVGTVRLIGSNANTVFSQAASSIQ